jgi:hypothetical protein
MTKETRAIILRLSITHMADKYADAAADLTLNSTLSHLYPGGDSAEKAEKARRAKHRRRAALDRLNRALANLAQEG